jgi:hypothetical protein
MCSQYAFRKLAAKHNPLVLKFAREKHISDNEEFKLLFTHMAASGNPGGGDVLDGPARRSAASSDCDCRMRPYDGDYETTPPDPTTPPGTT